jgi:Na+-translocating ferredoxin:NAD+ oxidoreductase RnfC subunit
MASIESIEFIDCGSINIQYDATGKATVSLVVVKNDNSALTGCYPPSLGGVSWDVSTMTAIQRAIIGSDGWYEWHMQFQGWGN